MAHEFSCLDPLKLARMEICLWCYPYLVLPDSANVNSMKFGKTQTNVRCKNRYINYIYIIWDKLIDGVIISMILFVNRILFLLCYLGNNMYIVCQADTWNLYLFPFVEREDTWGCSHVLHLTFLRDHSLQNLCEYGMQGKSLTYCGISSPLTFNLGTTARNARTRFQTSATLPLGFQNSRFLQMLVFLFDFY